MTQKEIDKFLANTKVYVNGKSKEIQEKLFSLGYSWNEECTGTDVYHTEAPFLFIYEDTSITMSSDMDIFYNHENSEISAEEILSLELTEPSYRPFKNSEECWNEMLKHQPFGWLKSKECGCFKLIGEVAWIDAQKEVAFTFSTQEKEFCNQHDLFNKYTFLDGTPFGIKEETKRA